MIDDDGDGLTEWRSLLAHALTTASAIDPAKAQRDITLSRQLNQAWCEIGRCILQMQEHLPEKQWVDLLEEAGVTPPDRYDYICIFKTSVHLHLSQERSEP